MNVFRTPEQQSRYDAYRSAGNLDKGCVLCYERASLKEFQYWRIIENAFPYDAVAKIHHMVIPKRHVTELGLSGDEVKEFNEIKEEHLHKSYDFMIESMHGRKTIPDHFHVHMVVTRI